MIYNVKKISYVKIEAKAIAELWAIEVNAPKRKTKLKLTIIPKVSDNSADNIGINNNKTVINKKDRFSLAFNETYFDIG